jgi:hypothetical protein
MEIIREKTFMWVVNLSILIFSLLPAHVFAQNKFSVRDGNMHIVLSRHQSILTLDSFLVRYGLNDLNSKQYYSDGFLDSIKAKGWNVLKVDHDVIVIAKPLDAIENINAAENSIILGSKNKSEIDFDKLRAETVFGYNRFVNKRDFKNKNGTVTFFLRGNTNAKTVYLSGTFNDWSTMATLMNKKDSGWVVDVDLPPGKYWYKFIVDGRWVEDIDNLNKEKNQYNGFNSVYYCTNYSFFLRGFLGSKKVFLNGSFNDWKINQVRMHPSKIGWHADVYLAEGTYTYKYWVNGLWVIDSGNSNKVDNAEGTYNSIITIGTPTIFKLKGFKNAKKVILAGSFNNWSEQQLSMQPIAEGWSIPFGLRPGNYQYKFIVDGKWITDPDNALTVANDNGDLNSIIIIKPNYTFNLKGYDTAKRVAVSGTFNDWDKAGYPMKKVGDKWVCSVYLSPGKQLYKFIVDGKWIIDPANKIWEGNEFDTGNSLLWVDK